MRLFGGLFCALGAVLAAVSAWAISDPRSPIGWGRWTDDPWSLGLIAGIALLAVGVLILVAKRYVSREVERRTTRVVATAVAAIAGFLLFAPFGVTSICAAGASGCRNQDWSTVTGFTFSGDPNPALGIAVGVVVGVVTWLLVGRAQSR